LITLHYIQALTVISLLGGHLKHTYTTKYHMSQSLSFHLNQTQKQISWRSARVSFKSLCPGYKGKWTHDVTA